MSLKRVNFSIYRPAGQSAAGAMQHDGTTLQLDNGEPPLPVREIVGQVLTFWIAPPTDYGHHAILRIQFIDGQVETRHVTLAAHQDLDVVPAVQFRPRPGLVRLSRRSWLDDWGGFYPRGATFFWLMQAAHAGGDEWERARRQLRLLAEHGAQAVRMLCQVRWPHWPIDPAWPDYQTCLARVADTAYDEFGLRLHVTLIGDAGVVNKVSLVDQVVEVLMDGRSHKVLLYEPANEYSRTDKATIQDLDAMVRRLRATTPNLVTPSALSSDASMDRMMSSGAQVSNRHGDRKWADFGCRMPRQAYDFHVDAWGSIQGEPGGPFSSVHSYDEPDLLAANRAIGIICGAGAYNFHHGGGIFGKSLPGRGPANIADDQNASTQMQAVFGVDEILPPDLPNFTVVNDTGPGSSRPHPLKSRKFWGAGFSNDGTGLNKNYCARRGRNFAICQLGARTQTQGQMIELVATEAATLAIYDIVTRVKVVERAVDVGEAVRLPGSPDARRSYLTVGTLL